MGSRYTPSRLAGSNRRQKEALVKVLVAIANHGTRNAHHLQRLLTAYRASRFSPNICVLSDVPKDLGPDIDVRVGLPVAHGWSLPFAHRAVFAEHQMDFDLFVYCEDDTLLMDAHLTAFIEANALLAPDEIAGFLRHELDANGEPIYECMHSAFRFLPETVRIRGGKTFAAFSNQHSACSLMTRDQLRKAIASGGFLVAPHEDRYDLLCAGGNDIYTQCGFTRLICVSEIERFSLHHLSNKYVDTWGVPGSEVRLQASTLERLAQQGGWLGPLIDPETTVPAGTWWKNLHSEADGPLLDLVPEEARRILVVGSGSGVAEQPLLKRAESVVLLPIDPVLGACAERRGFEVICAGRDAALAELKARRFDCIVFPWVLHLADDPVAWIRAFSSLLEPDGSVVFSLPKMGDVARRDAKISPLPGADHLSALRRAWTSWLTYRRIRRWLRECGLRTSRSMAYESGQHRRDSRPLRRIHDACFASAVALRAVRTR
jgi:SAM-dependent methyltransferase